MPRPRAGEPKSSYIARFMESSEAQSDFPDEKQRLAVAYSMWGEKQNAYPSYGGPTWPKAYATNFIEPGVVAYQDLGPCKVCGDAFSCGKNAQGQDLCQPEGAIVLLKQDAIERFAKSLVGRPVTIDHQDVSPNTVTDGEADGIVTRVWRDDKTGWWNAEYLAWSPEAQQYSEDPNYSVSCAYDPKETDDNGGEYHSIPYASEILDGEMTHLALVKNPRYEGAKIWPSLQNRKALANSKKKGGSMFNWKFWEKGASRKNALPLNPEEMVNVDGKDVPLKNLYDALEDPKPKFNDDSMFETPKGDKSLGELKAAYRNKLKNEFGQGGVAIDPTKGAAKAEPGHSEHKEGELVHSEPAKCKECGAVKNAEPEKDGKGEEKALPDMRDHKQNDMTEEGAKKFDAETKEVEALERRQTAEKKDAELKAAKEKADEEMRQAADKAEEEKEKVALENSKKEAGRKSFEDLRSARLNAAGVDSKIMPVDISERLAKGKEKYGRSA